MNQSIGLFVLCVFLQSCTGCPGRSLPADPAADSTRISKAGDTVWVNAERYILSTEFDTVLLFDQGGRTFGVVASKHSLWFEGFQDFLNYPPKDLTAFDKIRVEDVTGDGEADSCISRILIGRDSVWISHSVRSVGHTIFEDSVVLQGDQCESALWFGDPRSYERLKPYSTMYAARKEFVDFVSGPIDTNSANHAEFLQRHVGEEEHWKTYFRSHDVYAITTIESDCADWIWDERARSFIEYILP